MAKNIRHNEVNSLEDLIKVFIRENNLSKGLLQLRMEELWKEQMGKGVAGYTRKVVLQGDTLIVYLSSSVLREELRYGKDKIIAMLNEAYGEPIIHKLRLT